MTLYFLDLKFKIKHMKKIIFVFLIIALFAMSMVYAYGESQNTAETFHVTDKRIDFKGNYPVYIIDTLEYGDITANAENYQKIRIDDTIKVELFGDSGIKTLIEINGQPV